MLILIMTDRNRKLPNNHIEVYGTNCYFKLFASTTQTFDSLTVNHSYLNYATQNTSNDTEKNTNKVHNDDNQVS